MVATKSDAEQPKSCNKSKCCWMKCIFAIVAFTITASLSGWLVWGNLYADLLSQYPQLWRPMEADQWSLMPVANLLHAIFFVFAFSKLGCCVTSKCGTNFGRGAMFGFYIFLFCGVLGGFWAYIIHPISIELASAYIVDAFIINVIGGGIIGLIKGKASSCAVNNSCEVK